MPEWASGGYPSFRRTVSGSRLYPGLPAGFMALVDDVLCDDVGGLAPWGVRAGQLRVALMIFRVQ
jgi:hypothetical protein